MSLSFLNEFFQAFQWQNLDFGAGRLGCNVHYFARTKGVRYTLAGFTGWFFNSFDLEQAWQSEFANPTFLHMTGDQVVQFVKNSSHLLLEKL